MQTARLLDNSPEANQHGSTRDGDMGSVDNLTANFCKLGMPPAHMDADMVFAASLALKPRRTVLFSIKKDAPSAMRAQAASCLQRRQAYSGDGWVFS